VLLLLLLLLLLLSLRSCIFWSTHNFGHLLRLKITACFLKCFFARFLLYLPEIKLQVVAAIGLADIFPDGFCDNPCRCSASVEKNGCELDDAVYGRSICSPAQPEECGAAFAIQGMASAAVHCGLGKESCQHFLSTSVCSPFVPLGTSVFVPAGETIESLEEPLRPVLLEVSMTPAPPHLPPFIILIVLSLYAWLWLANLLVLVMFFAWYPACLLKWRLTDLIFCEGGPCVISLLQGTR
jgi:hypothetical protein